MWGMHPAFLSAGETSRDHFCWDAGRPESQGGRTFPLPRCDCRIDPGSCVHRCGADASALHRSMPTFPWFQDPLGGLEAPHSHRGGCPSDPPRLENLLPNQEDGLARLGREPREWRILVPHGVRSVKCMAHGSSASVVWMCSSGGSEGEPQRDERGRLLLCWTRDPTRDRKSRVTRDTVGTHAVQLGTHCSVARSAVRLEGYDKAPNGWCS